MPISFRRFVPGASLLVPAVLLGLLSLTTPSAVGQESPTTPVSPLMKYFDRIDLSVVAAGSFSDSASGIEQRDANLVSTTTTGGVTYTSTSNTMLTIKPSSTVGELVTIRYIIKPYVGFEYNFGNSRLTQNTTFVTTTSTTPPTPPTVTTTYPTLLLGGAQAGIREITLGYIAHLPFKLPYGVQAYAGAGGGTLHFTPTRYGGQGLPFQYRAVYYYNVGLEDTFPNSHFGVRLGFRQLIYLAPDFQQNYLTITRRVHTSEPIIGFYLKF